MTTAKSNPIQSSPRNKFKIDFNIKAIHTPNSLQKRPTPKSLIAACSWIKEEEEGEESCSMLFYNSTKKVYSHPQNTQIPQCLCGHFTVMFPSLIHDRFRPKKKTPITQKKSKDS
jgi:hypothetical protein